MFYIETPEGWGSGWLIESGLILTNHHVVGTRSVVTVRQSGGPPFQATVVAVDSQRDIALLSFNPSIAQIPSYAVPLLLGNTSTAENARPLMALGYSSSGVKADGSVGAASAKVGVQSQIINFGAGSLGLNLRMDTPVDPGDSGGPVLDDDGSVVGMTRYRAEVGTFYAVHVDEIRAALPALKQGQSR
ncbi:MAG: trypsin-like peptidase domain-containing protein [Chloroflexi bacterium]|nr:trypsin-like peptidase domain-containing protein [Chloroflexota bacterium]